MVFLGLEPLITVQISGVHVTWIPPWSHMHLHFCKVLLCYGAASFWELVVLWDESMLPISSYCKAYLPVLHLLCFVNLCCIDPTDSWTSKCCCLHERSANQSNLGELFRLNLYLWIDAMRPCPYVSLFLCFSAQSDIDRVLDHQNRKSWKFSLGWKILKLFPFLFR